MSGSTGSGIGRGASEGGFGGTFAEIPQRLGGISANAAQNPPPRAVANPVLGEMVSADELNSFTEALKGILLMNIESTLNSFIYMGFDPVAFKAMVIKHLIGPGTGRTLAQAADIIKKALALVTMRGTKIRSVDKMNETGQALLKELAAVGIHLNPARGSQAPNVITLQRLAASFPFEVSRLLGSRRARIVGEAPEGFPMSLCHPNAAAFIPERIFADETHALRHGMRQWRTSFSRTINVGPSRMTDAQLQDNSERFEQIVFQSRLYSTSVREQLLVAVLKAEYRNLQPAERALFLTHVGDLASAVQS